MIMGHAGAVGGVLRSKAYILGLRLEVAVESTATQCTSSIHSPTDKEELSAAPASRRLGRAGLEAPPLRGRKILSF